MPRVASYFRHGFTMSRRAYISHKKNEHPITHWIKILALDRKILKRMLVNIGVHHTGLYAKRTLFYRLPKLNKEHEMSRFYESFRTIPASKKKCIKYLAEYLQQPLEVSKSADKNIKYIKLKDIFDH
jgi:hypothetical protein